MKHSKYILVLLLLTGCGAQSPKALDKSLLPGSPEEKRAILEVTRLAAEHGYRPDKMNLEVKASADTGNFSIYLFPKPTDMENLNREWGLFAMVNARSGQVISFSDPKEKPKPAPRHTY